MLDIQPRALRDGMAAALARNFDVAYPLLQQATTESPADVRGWLWRAVAAPSPADAISCLRRVLVVEPGHVQAQDALGRLLAAQANTLAAEGHSVQAAALAREATELAPESDAAWMALAAVSEDPRERLDAQRRAHDVNPQAAQARVQLRDTLLQSGIACAGADPDRARQFFKEAAVVDPTDPRIWQALARVAQSASDALEALRRLLQLTPDRPGLRGALKRALVADAESLAASGSRREAAARWRETVELDESETAAWIGLASTTDEADEARRALDTLERAGITDARVAELRARWQGDADPAEPSTPWPVAQPVTPSFETALIPVSRREPSPISPEPAASAPTPAPTFDLAPVAAPPTPGPSFAIPPATPPMSTPPPSAATPAPAPAVPVRPAAPAASGSGAKRTVMVVDDSPTVRKILTMTLERAGYGVVSAPDGEAALGTLEASVPDLILLDISMPKLDGYEVCKRIKADARTAHVPVVMLSGKDAFFDKVKGRMAGATEYLTKPFATPAVLAVIGRQFEAEPGTVHG